MKAHRTIGERDLTRLEPGATVWDKRLPGFGARRRAGSITFVLKYRLGGKQRWLTLGRHGVVTLDHARGQARRLLGLVAAGQDPAVTRDERKTAPTMRDLAQRFLDERASTKCKPRTAAEYRRLLDAVILPAIGDRKVVDVTRQDIAALHHSLRDTRYQGNRALACLSVMFTCAERWGLRPDGSNPCRHVERFPERRKERFLSAEEMARLGDALARAAPLHAATIRLLIFTGARLGEVLGLRWEWVDFERGEARLPDSKTGAKTLHLPAPALQVLAELPRVDDFVLGANERKPGERRSYNFIEISWKKIRQAARLDDVRIHDLRHAFASVAASSGLGLPIIGKMLGHTQQATTQRYAHLASDPVKAAAAAVAERIAAVMSHSSAKVFPLRVR
jgi:integrase